MQSSESPQAGKHSIFNSDLRPTVIILDTVRLFRKFQIQLPLSCSDEHHYREPDLSVCQPSEQELLQSFPMNSLEYTQ